MRIYLHLIAAFVFCLGICSAKAQDMPPTTSLVYPGVDGKLVYVADSLGNKIPDFSNAGYKGGGVAIPYVPVKATVWPRPGDNADNIQAAIDKVAALSPDAAGFRGAVLLKMGAYELEKPVAIKTSGIVLRGEGMSDVGTILIGKTPKETAAQGAPRGGRPALVNITGLSGWMPQEETKQTISDKYVPVGARSFSVASAKGFKAGDKVLVRRNGNEDWVRELGQDSLSAGRYRWRPFVISYDRVVTEVKGNNITIDAPVFCAIESRWGGGEIVKYNDTGRIEQVGIENLRGVSEYNPSVRMKAYGNMDRGNFDGPGSKYEGDEYYSDENHYFNFINFANVKNGWVRNITALHFGSSVVQTVASTKWITVQDCQSWEPVSIRAGARRFTYQLNGQLSLVQRCFSQKGRHSFVMQTSSSSGNVFFNSEAVNPYSSSEPHANWVNGALYDNIKAPLTARFWKDITIGWAGANIVFWNCEGDFLIQQPPTAQNYSFGHLGVASVIFNRELQELKKPNGYIESMDRHVTPKSLYLTQLKERLGAGAVENISNHF
ncbi:MAG: hypothetical protein INR73_20670 [Williamsia sp.]|nr:hypothetical protein [Williamsia sp.]